MKASKKQNCKCIYLHSSLGIPARFVGTGASCVFVCLYVCVYWFLTELLVPPSKKDITASYVSQPKTQTFSAKNGPCVTF